MYLFIYLFSRLYSLFVRNLFLFYTSSNSPSPCGPKTLRTTLKFITLNSSSPIRSNFTILNFLYSLGISIAPFSRSISPVSKVSVMFPITVNGRHTIGSSGYTDLVSLGSPLIFLNTDVFTVSGKNDLL